MRVHAWGGSGRRRWRRACLLYKGAEGWGLGAVRPCGPMVPGVVGRTLDVEAVLWLLWVPCGFFPFFLFECACVSYCLCFSVMPLLCVHKLLSFFPLVEGHAQNSA